MRSFVALVAAVVLAGCGSGRNAAGASSSTTPGGELWEPYSCRPGPSRPLSAECLAIAREYADAMPAAIACNPGDMCGALRPLIVSGEFPDGSVVLEGLCSCPVLVNGARSPALDAALARFIASGCGIGCCPCPPVEPTPGPCPTDGPRPGTCG